MTNPEVLEGEIMVINQGHRYFTLADRQGKAIAKIFWSVQHDAYMQNQRPGFYEKLTAVLLENDDYCYHLEDIRYHPRPPDFPRKANSIIERLETLRRCYEQCAGVAKATMLVPDEVFSEEKFNNMMDIIVQRSLQDAALLCWEAGL